jgi:ATP-dependent Clp protease adaptor protein ClpS
VFFTRVAIVSADVCDMNALLFPSGHAKPYGSIGKDQMSDIVSKTRSETKPKTQRPRLHKVILLNDDYTPREFVVLVLKREFRTTEEQAQKVMLTAHQKGACVVAVYTRDVAETKATRAIDYSQSKGYPLQFATEPEE